MYRIIINGIPAQWTIETEEKARKRIAQMKKSDKSIIKMNPGRDLTPPKYTFRKEYES